MSGRKDFKVMQGTLLNLLAANMLPHGFGSTVRGQSLWRNFPDGRASIHLQFIEHSDDFDITCDVAIRFDELEDMINTDNKLLSRKEKRDTYSLGIELGNLRDGVQKRWTVRSPDDIESVAKQIAKMVSEVAVPYIEEFSIMTNALQLLSRDDREAWAHSPIHDGRAKRAIGLATLVGVDKKSMEELIEQKRAFLSERADFGLENFLGFAARVIGKELIG